MDYIYILKWIGVFISMLLVDVCWTKYFVMVTKHRPMPAAIWGSMILLLGAFTTINYIDDKMLLIPTFIGGSIGTYLTVEWERRKSLKIKTKDQCKSTS